MTATRDRDLDYEERRGVPWNDRAMFGQFRGLPWWVAVISAFILSGAGAYFGIDKSNTVSPIFGILLVVGCIAAAVFVERRSMFGPIVQPPLVVVIVIPIMVLLTKGTSGSLLSLGQPLIESFPFMAAATAGTVVVGIIRIATQKDPRRVTKAEMRAARETVKSRKSLKTSTGRAEADDLDASGRIKSADEIAERSDSDQRRRIVRENETSARINPRVPPRDPARARIEPDQVVDRSRPLPPRGSQTAQRRQPPPPPQRRPQPPRDAR